MTAVDLVKTFKVGRNSTAVLSGINLAIRAGESVSIVGPSGSGKSTLLYCLSGLEPATSGLVHIDGTDVAKMSARQRARHRRAHVGFIFQSYNLVPTLSVRDNVGIPARLAGIRSSTVADDVLDRVGLSGRGSAMPSSLSGGEQQRVAIARILAIRPPIVFADEPTGALDSETATTIMGELMDLKSPQSSVILVTHDLDSAARTDRALVLRDGEIRHQLLHPSAAELFQAVQSTKIEG